MVANKNIDKEKQLLIKDMSARIPYGLKVRFSLPDYSTKTFNDEVGTLMDIDYNGGVMVSSKGIDYRYLSLDVKPFLRLMDSMTMEERIEYIGECEKDIKMMEGVAGECEGCLVPSYHHIDWLDSHFFDYRGLIGKGLAIDAEKDLYWFSKVNV